MKKMNCILIITIVIIILLTACSEKDTDTVRNKIESPDKKYIAIIVDYSLSAIAPGGQKVYIENIDGTDKNNIVLEYGYENTVKWINESTLEITIEKIYNQNNYDIQIMEKKYKNINIIYKKTISDGFDKNEKWEP
jgi:hypothetical protein